MGVKDDKSRQLLLGLALYLFISLVKCRLLIIFANSSDPDQGAWQNIWPDLDRDS